MKTRLRKIIQFILFSTITLVIGLFDMLLTYVGTPNLSSESNPIVNKLGGGWIALILVNVILVLVCITLYYYSFIRFKPDLIECDNFKQYMSMLYFGRPDKFIWTLYKIPKLKRCKKYILACCGCLAFSINIVRCRAVLEWILVITNRELAYNYFSIFEGLSFNTFLGRFDMLILMLVVAILTYFIWFYLQYKSNQKKLRVKDVRIGN